MSIQQPGRATPRVLVRAYSNPEQLDASIAFYERVLGVARGMRFTFPEADLELAAIGSILLVCGSEQALARVRATAATILVDRLDDHATLLRDAGAEILDGPTPVPTGRNLHARHPDGLLVEYVEHRPNSRAQPE